MSDPLQTEATGDPQIITWEGVDIVLPSSVDDWDMDALEAFENGRAATFLRQLVGNDAYSRMRKAFTDAHGRKPKVSDFGTFTEQVAKLYGFGSSGESSAS